MSLTVSVVIPTYKRPDLLNRCLEALIRQDFNPADYEIIVVDDAGSPETETLVQSWIDQMVHLDYWPFPGTAENDAEPNARNGHRLQSKSKKRLIHVVPGPEIRYLAVSGDHGPAAARNLGWQSARGEIIAFTDDDTIPDRGWIKAGVAAFTGVVAGVSGRIVMPIPPKPTDYEKDAAGLTRSEFVTANCFYRRYALEASGGFDTRYRVAWREDTDLFFTLLRMNARLVHAEDAVVVHPIRPATWGISLQQQKKSMFNALLYRKHPILYRERVQPTPPLVYYAVIGSMALFLVGLFANISLLYGLGALMWLLLTSAFAVRRLRGTKLSAGHTFEMGLTSILIPWLSIYWRLRGAIQFRVWFL